MNFTFQLDHLATFQSQGNAIG